MELNNTSTLTFKGKKKKTNKHSKPSTKTINSIGICAQKKATHALRKQARPGQVGTLNKGRKTVPHPATRGRGRAAATLPAPPRVLKAIGFPESIPQFRYPQDSARSPEPCQAQTKLHYGTVQTLTAYICNTAVSKTTTGIPGGFLKQEQTHKNKPKPKS